MSTTNEEIINRLQSKLQKEENQTVFLIFCELDDVKDEGVFLTPERLGKIIRKSFYSGALSATMNP